MKGMMVIVALMQGWLAVAFLFFLALVATQDGGRVVLLWNRYNEMWPEVVALGLITALYPFAVWWALRRAV